MPIQADMQPIAQPWGNVISVSVSHTILAHPFFKG